MKPTRNLADTMRLYLDRQQAVFAYGSNLDPRQMRARCPNACAGPVVGLPGYRLAFCGYSRGRRGSVLSLEVAHTRWVPGQLWYLWPSDLDALDAYEGVPWVYETRVVQVVDTEGVEHSALTYVHKLAAPQGLPGAGYVAQVRAAYRRLRIQAGPLDDAIARAHQVMAQNT